MPELDCTTALVTGGTSGLGLAMASALNAAGVRVALTGRSRERAERAAAELGQNALGLELDVTNEESVRRGVRAALDRLGRIELLVNNAGIGMRTVNPDFLTDSQPLWEVTPAGFRAVLETKVTGCFLTAREVVPAMLSAGRGRIVTISMNEQTMVRRGFVPYGPSGAAVEALARVLAADLEGTPVRANILLPGGPTATGMIPDGIPEAVRSRLLDPSVMGPPIVWLASGEAATVHGERIVATDFERWVTDRTRAEVH